MAGAFRSPHEPVLQLMAEATPVLAQCAARDLGFARSTGDWRDLMIDPTVDVVDICTPPASHAEMALAAIAAGKHV